MIPWDKVKAISFGKVSVVDEKVTQGDDRLKISSIKIVVEDDFLKDYGMFKNNIYLSGNTLSIICSDFKTVTQTDLQGALEQVGVHERFKI